MMSYCINQIKSTEEEAREMIERFKLSDIQARAIVEMRASTDRSRAR
jgi:DNA gyrase/topoisomerase IV subunit A